jgi:hypothetical protein
MPNECGGFAADCCSIEQGTARSTVTPWRALPDSHFDDLSGISFQTASRCAALGRPNSLFHIRVRLDRDKLQTPLTDALLATTLLKSAEFYDSKFRWHIALFLLMPDHVHALLAFQRDGSMSRIIGDWKHFHARKNRIEWQRAFSIIDCAMTSAGSNCKPRSITSGKILS